MTSTVATNVLRSGAVGPLVKDWTVFLASQGVIGNSRVTTDTFSRVVVEDTQRYQQREGLEVDGIVGPQTWTRAVQQGFVVRPASVLTAGVAVADDARMEPVGVPAASPAAPVTSKASDKPAGSKQSWGVAWRTRSAVLRIVFVIAAVVTAFTIKSKSER